MAILPGQIGGAILTLGGLAASNRNMRNMRNMKGSGSNDNDNNDENDNSKRSLIRLIVTVVETKNEYFIETNNTHQYFVCEDLDGLINCLNHLIIPITGTKSC